MKEERCHRESEDNPGFAGFAISGAMCTCSSGTMVRQVSKSAENVWVKKEVTAKSPKEAFTIFSLVTSSSSQG